MKKVKIRSNFHDTEVTFFAPEGFRLASEVMDWLEASNHWESHGPTGSGAMTRKYKRVWRGLCPYGCGCKCGYMEGAL